MSAVVRITGVYDDGTEHAPTVAKTTAKAISIPSSGTARIVMAVVDNAGNKVDLAQFAGGGATVKLQVNPVLPACTSSPMLTVVGQALMDAHAITYDFSSHGEAGSNQVWLDHTIGDGSARILLVSVASRGNTGTDTLPAVTYNGVAMTLARTDTTAGYSQRTSLFYMLDAQLPASGTYKVTVTTTGSFEVAAGSVSLADAFQGAPEAVAGVVNGVGADSTLTRSITTTGPNSWVVGTASSDTGATPAWTGGLYEPTVRVANIANGVVSQSLTTTLVATGSESFTVHYPRTYDRATITLASVAPAAGSPTPSVNEVFFAFTPDMTRGLPWGRYWYDAWIETTAGDRYQLISPAILTLSPALG